MVYTNHMHNTNGALSNSLQFYNYSGDLALPRSFSYVYAIVVHNQNSVVHRYIIGKFWNPVFLYIFHQTIFLHSILGMRIFLRQEPVV